MYSIDHLPRRARRAGTSTLLASLAAFGLLSTVVPSAAAQSAPTVSVDDVVVTEGDTAVFNVRVSGSHPNFSVDYRTQDVSAVAPDDYTSTSGTLVIPAGSSVVPINVPTAKDKIWEPTETFKLLLSNSAVTIQDGVAIASVEDNDPVPTINISDASVTEGDNPFIGTNAVFDVTVTNAASEDMTVDYKTVNGTAVGNPILSFGDYQTKSGTLTFPANTKTKQQILVPVRGDTTHEPDETFQVQLSNPVNAQLGTSVATGTITDDDLRPRLTIDPTAVVTEGNGSPNATVVLTVSASNPSFEDVTFDVNTSNGSARAGDDYVRIKGGSGTLLAGHTSTTISVEIIGDKTKENDEDFFVTISNPSGASLGNATSTVTVQDDD
jgi:hypothetical protein